MFDNLSMTNFIFRSHSGHYKVDVWDAANMKTVEQYQFEDNRVYHFHMSGNADLIAVAVKREIRLVDMRSGFSAHALSWSSEEQRRVCWSPEDANLLVSGDAFGRIVLWDIRRSNQPLIELVNDKSSNESSAHGGAIRDLCFSPTMRNRLASFGRDSRIREWRIDVIPARVNDIGSLASEHAVETCYSYGGDLIFVPTGSAVAALSVQSRRELYRLRAHFSSVNSCICDPASGDVYSGGSDSELLRWTNDHFEERPSRGVKRNYQQATEDDWSDDEVA